MIPAKEEWYKALEKKQSAAVQQKRSLATIAICGCGGLISSRVMLCAAHQAHAIIRIVCGKIDV
ncbi:MAG: hypothetical protein K6G80_11265 [Treponema sp.]|nr:hypothetical protein [Treponema sp.]